METLQPKLRFPEFEEKYINKRVDDFAPLQRGFDLPITKMVKGKFPVVFSNGISKTHNEFKVKAPGIVTGRSGTIGNLFYIEEDFWPHNTSLWVTNFKGNFPKYVYYFYDKFDLKRFGTGSGVPTLNRNDVHNQQIYIPSPEEQTKIANFLSSVDEKLNLLKEKKSLLEDYKKGIMQKIFNQELRFKDDNGNDFDDWEEILISELTNVIVGGTPSTTKEEYWNGDIAWLSSGELNNGLVTKAKKHITEIGLKKSSAKIMKPNTVMLAMTGATLGKIGFLTFESCGNQSIAGFEPNNKYVSKFFYYNILFNKNLILSMAGGAAQQGINKASIESLFFTFPNLQEQTKIANFLSAIDEKIELVSNQIQDTLEYKKGLLQQMFV